MKLSEFYNAILPDEGKLVLGTKEKFFKHVVCDDHAALQQATIKAAKTGTDVYYALASFKQGFHENAKGKKVVRVRDNVHKLKALWFDIDFKGGLSNPTEVVAAIREFCTVTRMPAPSILVHSGNGIHVYWPLQTAIAHSRWQAMADALKSAASAHGLPADLVCTADPARVLRPIGTRNLKDPATPKPVKPLWSSGKLYDPRELEASLLGSSGSGDELVGAVPAYLSNYQLDQGGELSVGAVGRAVEAFIPNIARKCGVIAHVLETNGEDCSEPEWTACLQLAKHCADGELYYHDLSSGHPDYTPEDTAEKWQQRLENTAGPTVCDTFAAYRPEICKACKHRGSIKTPLSLGEEEVVAADGKEFPLQTWRPIEGNNGMERKMFDPQTKQYFWEKVLTRTWELNVASRDIETGIYSFQVVSKLGNSDSITVDMAGRLLGDTMALKKELAERGCPIQQSEVTHWINLMDTWLKDIQRKRNVNKAVSRLGWVEERKDGHTRIIGFTAGDTNYGSDGNNTTGLKMSHQYRQIAAHYMPNGDFEEWKAAADFIAGQEGTPQFTAVLASAFAAPLFGFAGMDGCILAIVSKQSGLGKTSALKVAQAVWGSPTKGMNSTTDTANSIVSKVAFLKNLPVYWDEIRGEAALTAFRDIAFQIAQGKEKTRLTQQAEMREIHDWKTLLVGASNESLFDYMGQQGGASDATTARVLELEIMPFDDPTRATRNAMFRLLDSNYGHAGQRYAEYIATRHKPISEMVRKTYENLFSDWHLREGERFWCATAAALLVGAAVAKKAGIVNFDVPELKHYLHNRILELRIKTSDVLTGGSARELVLSYIAIHKTKTLVCDQFPKPGAGSDPQVLSAPKDGTLCIVQVGNTYRFLRSDFVTWLLKSKQRRWSSVNHELKNDLQLLEMKTRLGGGTLYELPRGQVLEVTL